MRSKERLLDDIARLAGGAVGSLGQIGGQIKGDLRSRVDDLALRMDLVPREEFERLEAMFSESRIQQAEMIARIEKLEAQLSKKTKPAATDKKQKNK
jgi:BMFP domain-containing protein YqiC